MAKESDNGNSETTLQIILGFLVAIIAIFAIKSLFEHDNSKILSNKGSQMLSDGDKMKELDDKLRNLDQSAESEIVI